jgi:MATE family multidrug resistance protein
MAAAVCVGRAMGEANAKKAIQYATLIVFYSFLTDFVLGIFISIFRQYIAEFFTNQEELIDLVASILPLMSIALTQMGLGFTMAGVMRGLGMQGIATWVILFSYYCVSLTTGYLFAFKANIHLNGLWFGIHVGLLAEIFIYISILKFYTNWTKLAYEIN